MTPAPDFRALAQELFKHARQAQAILIGEGLWDVDDDEGLFDRADKALATPPPEPGKSIDELIAGCKPLDPAMAEMLTPDARWRLFGEDDSLPPPPKPQSVPWANVQKAAEEAFAAWWSNEGSGMPPEHGEEAVIHVERISKIAWSNGAYIVASIAAPPPEPPEPPTELPVLTPGYIDFEHTGQDREILDAFYRACNSEGGTADEIHLRGIRAVLERWGHG